jgi:hypothetical protein
MRAALLDLNVLIALFDGFNVNHEASHAWFHSLGSRKWATCPLTLNGFVRIVSHPRHPSAALTVAGAAAHLRTLCRHDNHVFWPDDLPILDETLFDLGKLAGPGQVTDVYLLALAVARGGQLVTFDRSIPWQAVRGAKPSHLRVLGGR